MTTFTFDAATVRVTARTVGFSPLLSFQAATVRVTGGTVNFSLDSGQPPVDDYDSHWHYARQKKKERALKAKLNTPRLIVGEARLSAPTLRAEVSVRITNAVAGSSTLGGLRSVGMVRQLPNLAAQGVARIDVKAGSVGTVRVLDAVQELGNLEAQIRDLEDMVDLYKLLMAA